MSRLLEWGSRLDRRVLGGRAGLATPERWVRAMGQWRWQLWTAVWFASMAVTALFLDFFAALGVLGAFYAVWFAFRAGAMKAEHDRLNGSDKVLGARRPPGL